jgi:tetratricopeptide (TPR) repeat protein
VRSGKCYIIYILLVSLVMLLTFSNAALAGKAIFLKEYTYSASDIDSKVSSRAIALEQVKRALLEQLGTYLITETDVKNFQITRDQITTLTAGIVSAEIVDEKWDGKNYYLKAKITADPAEISRSVDAFRKDAQKSKELEDTKKKAEAALQEVARLRKALLSRDAGSARRSEYDRAIDTLSANDLFYEGFMLLNARNYREAIDTFSKAIHLNPDSVEAYNNRGFAYNALGLYPNALDDINRALIVDPKNVKSYVLRGIISENSKMDEKFTLENYEHAIKIDPLYSEAYYYLGTYYMNHSTSVLGFVSASSRSSRKGPTVYSDNAGKPVTKFHQDIYDKGVFNLKIAARLGHKKSQDYLKAQNMDW